MTIAARSWAEVAIPPLACADPVRDDDALARVVDAAVLKWIDDIGIFADQPDHAARSRFGRFAMLIHPDTDDPDRLLLAAQNIAAQFAVDDCYCDDEERGAVPALLGHRLSRTLPTMEPTFVVGGHQRRLDTALRADPVLAGLASVFERTRELGSATQVARFRHETMGLFLTMNEEASWRLTGYSPPVWEYLAQRQTNSFLPCMVLIDLVGGYEISSELYFSPALRKANVLAASAAICVNDLYSAAKESRSGLADYNLPSLIAAQRECPPQEAMLRAAAIHDEFMHEYEKAETVALRDAPPVAERFLGGVRAWLAGSNAWHRDSGRYQAD